MQDGSELSADCLGKKARGLPGQLVGKRVCVNDFMNDGAVSTFPASVELQLKRNDETHHVCVNLEPIAPSPHSSHAHRLFQVKFQVTSSFPSMELSGLTVRYTGGDEPFYLWKI